MLRTVSNELRVSVCVTAYATLLALGIAMILFMPALGSSGFAHPATRTRIDEPFFSNYAIRHIITLDDWHTSTNARRCVLFVDCDWNDSIVQFRQVFSRFADGTLETGRFRAATMKLDGDCYCATKVSRECELWEIMQKFWCDNLIEGGGLKTLGGAGRVVWIDQGEVVDYAWCTEVSDVEQLKSRTLKAFRE